ncbi:BCCT family transporter [Biformimicrobium ophioploci]|uniref:Choline BCCT transporter BetT n=1 Tax=Biformimicrobium ophioploci TaxID=3036711 RepID=A0ABQ6M0X1_9GAMM|nr:BCCT family transporter [Microbulbifer sp. NKW57]GMG87986.1 choline BCCT transporter BetT [Microbulbifer sp. NKW57]
MSSNGEHGLLARIRSRSQLSLPVALPAAILIGAFVLFGTLYTKSAAGLFSALQTGIVERFGWLYLISVAFFTVFCIVLMFSRYGDVKLGLNHEEPEYGFRSWFAMLFSAGMGIGLIFYGVAEPLTHYVEPPLQAGSTPSAARNAMAITFFHWGIHAWAIYAVVGMCLAYFSFRHKLPLTPRSALYPLLGDKIYGPIGHAVDVFAVLGTLFGVATSLGLGVMQINAGISHLTGVGQNVTVQILLIAGVTAIATLSVVAGLDAGIKRLSIGNLVMAVALMLFILVVGNTGELLNAFVQNIGTYLDSVLPRTFNMYAYVDSADWLSKWTLFYWGWWIAWSPFVGMFIARVSRGRTIREFLMGVLFVPVGFTFLWMTVLGNSALGIEQADPGSLSEIVKDNLPISLYQFLEQFPWAAFTSTLATLLIVTFFVTSADSGSLVIDTITSGGREHPHTWQRVFWAVSEGAVAAILLLAGGLSALQTASIMSALPFAAVMLVMCFGLYKGLSDEKIRMDMRVRHMGQAASAGGGAWQDRLKAVVTEQEKDDAHLFLTTTCWPALRMVCDELLELGLNAKVVRDTDKVVLTVDYGEEPDFIYGVHLTRHEAQSGEEEAEDTHYYRADVHLRKGGQDYDILGYSREQVINDLLAHYDRHIQFLHATR